MCSGINGFFSPNEELSIIEKINKEKPDILFIGISSPIKERFALKYKNILKTKVIIPCGGYLDVLAGKEKRPAINFKWFPTTWFYRFLQSPKLFKSTVYPVFYFGIKVLPILLFKHFLNIERNPSILKYYGHNLDEIKSSYKY